MLACIQTNSLTQQHIHMLQTPQMQTHLDVPGANLHGNYLASWMAAFVIKHGSKEGAGDSLQGCRFVQTASE